jgi:uncharacterized YigZ family protein
MNEQYLKPSGYGEAGFTEKRSSFIGQVIPVGSESEALAHIKSVKEKQAGARHNPYAYILRNGGYTRYSDDGEPQGTAGMPILDVFRREGVTDFCCVVTRFFGGILLGAPGLTRAYARAAKLGLDASGISEMKLLSEITLQLPYRYLDTIRLELEKSGGRVMDAQYGQDVRLSAVIGADDLSFVSGRIREISSGTVEVIKLGEYFMKDK